MKKITEVCRLHNISKRCTFLSTSAEIQMSKKQDKSKNKASSAVVSSKPAPISLRGENVVIQVLAKPGAKHNNITDIGAEGVSVQIAAPPVDGEANTELVKYVSKIIGLRKSDVALEKGAKSRNKTLVVTGISKDDVVNKLQTEIDS